MMVSHIRPSSFQVFCRVVGSLLKQTNQKLMYLVSKWSWASPDSNKTSIAQTPTVPLKFNLQGNNIDNALLEDQIPVEHHHVWVLSLLDSSLIPIITIKIAENYISPNQRPASHVPSYSTTILFSEKKQLKNLMLWNFESKKSVQPKKTWDFFWCPAITFQGPNLAGASGSFSCRPVDPWTRKGGFLFVSFLGGWKKTNPMLKRRVTRCAGV